MTYQEIIDILIDNGYRHVAVELDKRVASFERPENAKLFFSDTIMDCLFNRNQIEAEDFLFSQDFGFAKAVALVLARFHAVVDIDMIEGELIS